MLVFIILLVVGVVIGCVTLVLLSDRENQAAQCSSNCDLKEQLRIVGVTLDDIENHRYDDRTKKSEPLVIKAIQADCVDVVGILLDNDYSPKIRDKRGTPALTIATRKDSTECMRMLLEAGADVNAMDKDGNTALFFVQSMEAFLILIHAGAIVTATNHCNRTPLFYISGRNDGAELVKAFIKKGVDPKQLDNSGRNALFFARNDNIVNILVKSGADIECADENGQTPIYCAANKSVQLAFVKNKAILVRKDKNGNGVPGLDALENELESLKKMSNVRDLMLFKG